MMTRQELFEWLNTHPTSDWDVVNDDEGHLRVLFWFDEEIENDHA